ncbi:MAG: aldehyde dehydrogenase family protein [Nitrospinae bacterium]|nr:aldehyde dehydrogenase family protein [Nitrospinota bacterium]
MSSRKEKAFPLLSSGFMKICRKFALGSPLIPLENSIFNFDVRKSTEFSILKGKGLSNGFFFEPTLFAEVSPKMRIAQEEIFGPVLSIIACRNLDYAIQITNDSKYGLSSAIYTQDVNRAFKAIEMLDTGITYINSSTIGAEIQLPFGGTKGTGNGHREAGTAAIETFTEWKSVYVDYSGTLQKAQIDD